MEIIFHKRSPKNPYHVPRHNAMLLFQAPQFHSLPINFPSSLSLSLSHSLSSSLESTNISQGDSFLFVEEEGEISSERLLAGHSVLPSHNHRNPGGIGEGLLHTKLFADVDTQGQAQT